MTDFSSLLRKPAGQAKKPPVLPAANFFGVIKSYEIGDNNKNKTPYVRFQVGLTDWTDEAPEEWQVVDSSGEEQTIVRSDVDLSKKTLRRDYYLTDDALWRLDDLLRSLGIDMDSGEDYEITIPKAVGAQVLVEVQQIMAQQSGDWMNQIGGLTAAD